MTADDFATDFAELTASYESGPRRGVTEKPTVPVTGDMYFDVAAREMQIYDGKQWIKIKA